MNGLLGKVAFGVGVGLVVWYIVHKAAPAVKNAVDPTSTENLAYKAVNAVGDTLNDGTPDGDFSLGSWFYDFLNREPDYTATVTAADLLNQKNGKL